MGGSAEGRVDVIFIGLDDRIQTAVQEAARGNGDSLRLKGVDEIDAVVDLLEREDPAAVVTSTATDRIDAVELVDVVRERAELLPCIVVVPRGGVESVEGLLADTKTAIVVDEGLSDLIESLAVELRDNAEWYRAYRRISGRQSMVDRLLDAGDDVVFVFTPDWGEVLYIKGAYETIFGQPLDDLSPADLLDAVHPDDRHILEDAKAHLSRGEQTEFECRVNEAADFSRWIWAKAHPILDGDEVEAVAGFIRDITDRKSQEQLDRHERDQFRALFEHFTDPMIAYRVVDGDPVIDRVNEAFIDVFGYDGTAEDRLREAKRLDHRIRTGGSDDDIVRRTPAGLRHFRFRTIEAPAEAEYDGFGIYSDIEADIRREAALNALFATSRDLTEATDKLSVAQIAVEAAEDVLGLPISGIWFYDHETDRLRPAVVTDRVNEIIEDIPTAEHGDGVGWKVFEGIAGLAYRDLRRDPDRLKTTDALRNTISVPLGDHGVFHMASVDADALDGSTTSLAQILAANTAAALNRADREATLRRQREELKHQNQRLEEFTSVVSHDLRTPLALATASMEQLKEENGDDHIEQIESAMSRMDDIIGKTLTLARSGRTVGDNETVDLADFAKQCYHLTGLADLHIEIDDELPTIDADPDRLRHVFENLFRNAAEHGGPGTTVSVTAKNGGFVVSDDGPGIPEDRRDQIFEAGYSSDPGGTGFGLTIVKRIAEAHGWSVEADTGDDGGARFVFRFDNGIV